MPKLAIEPHPKTAATLRRLVARRDRQQAALTDTRAELDRLIRRAVDRESATPQAIARIAGLTRPHIYKILEREERRHR